MKARPSHSQAFTIIELLIVIAIMALLTGIIMTSLTGSKAKSRDTKRISDLGQIQLAIELYFDRCKEYPATLIGTLTGINNGCPSGISLATYTSVIPKPPVSAGQTDYAYTPLSTPSNPSDYILHATLELPNEVIKDTPSTLGPPCSNDPAQKQYCLGPK